MRRGYFTEGYLSKQEIYDETYKKLKDYANYIKYNLKKIEEYKKSISELESKNEKYAAKMVVYEKMLKSIKEES